MVSNGSAGASLVLEIFARNFFAREKRGDFAAHAGVRFAGQRAPVNCDGAAVGHDVRLRAAADGADVHRRRAEQRMLAPSQSRGVIRFQHFHDARHFVDGIFAELRRRAVRRLAARFQFQPQTALVRGDHLQSRRLADDGQSLALNPLGRQRARTGLRVFLVHQSGENNFRFPRTRF